MDTEKMKKAEAIALCALFAIILAVGGILLFVLPHKEYSVAERRQLADVPERSFHAVMDGRFFSQADDWAADHFAGREIFRRVKAVWQTSVLLESENNGFASVSGSIVKLEKTVNGESLSYASERFRALYDEYLKSSDCRIYGALIPDKSVFLAKYGYPVMDYSEIEKLYFEGLYFAQPVAISETLELSDYYLTDSHWRQEKLIDTANTLLREMGREGALSAEDYEKGIYEPFYGVYAAQSAFDPPPESITYLYGGSLDGVRVMDLSGMRVIPMYDPENCDARDPYTLFLGGSKGILRIENPNVTDGSELIVFRDSFGSSIAPLLAAEYGTVTLIDIRYIHPAMLQRLLRFSDQDVLFLYSTTLLNNSQGLK